MFVSGVSRWLQRWRQRNSSPQSKPLEFQKNLNIPQRVIYVRVLGSATGSPMQRSSDNFFLNFFLLLWTQHPGGGQDLTRLKGWWTELPQCLIMKWCYRWASAHHRQSSVHQVKYFLRHPFPIYVNNLQTEDCSFITALSLQYLALSEVERVVDSSLQKQRLCHVYCTTQRRKCFGTCEN